MKGTADACLLMLMYECLEGRVGLLKAGGGEVGKSIGKLSNGI